MREKTGSLKRPDLKGQFPCRSCGQIFHHNASLTRHRRVKHNGSFTCLLCDNPFGGQDIGSHMQTQHNILRTYVCGCCDLVFDNKQNLHEHVQSVKTGESRQCTPIAKFNDELAALKPLKILKAPKSSTSTTTSSSTSPTSTRAPTPPLDLKPVMLKDMKWEEPPTKKSRPSKPSRLFDVDESCDKLLNDAVERILKSGVYSSEKLVFLETWEQIVNTARVTVMRNLERKATTLKNLPAATISPPGKFRPAKRARSDYNE